MTDQEIKEYAEAIIVAFERKKTIKAKAMKMRDWSKVSAIIAEYLVAKEQDVSLEEFLAERRESKGGVIAA